MGEIYPTNAKRNQHSLLRKHLGAEQSANAWWLGKEEGEASWEGNAQFTQPQSKDSGTCWVWNWQAQLNSKQWNVIKEIKMLSVIRFFSFSITILLCGKTGAEVLIPEMAPGLFRGWMREDFWGWQQRGNVQSPILSSDLLFWDSFEKNRFLDSMTLCTKLPWLFILLCTVCLYI